jgi:two-component system nitrate/nitrite response regulator NarL
MRMDGVRTTIGFVDDHPILLEGLKGLFSDVPLYSVIATGRSANEAWQIVEAHQPDVLFMDLSMPGDVFSVIGQIVKSFARTKVVVYTAFSGLDSAMRALDAGATGFVLKSSPVDEIFAAVESVMREDLFITGQYASQVMSGLRNRAQREAFNREVKLNVREKQIVEYLRQARTNREIAASMSISEKTVKHYMTILMQKLHARNRVEVVIQSQNNIALD